MKRELVCIICPKGCRLSIEYEGNRLTSVNGAVCFKGKEFATSEIADPRRNFVGSVSILNGSFRTLSVKSNRPIPLEKLTHLGKLSHEIVVEAPVEVGDKVATGLLDGEVDLIATRKVQRESKN